MLFYLVSLAVFFLTNTIFVFGLNLQFGMAGIVDLAFVAFFAVGGYLDAVLSLGPSNSHTAHLLAQTYILGMNLPWPLPVLAGILGGAIAAWVIGKFVLREIRSDFAALATVAVMQFLWNTVANIKGLFNGSSGLIEIPGPWQQSLHLSPTAYNLMFLGLCTIWCAIAWIFVQRLSASPFGRALKTVRENPTAALALGKNVNQLRLIAFVLGGALAALAGALFVEYTTVWSPLAWTFPETVLLFAALYIGGRGNNNGAMLGAAVVYVALSEGARLLPPISGNSVINAALEWIVIAALMIAFIWLKPNGLIPEKKAEWPERAAGAEFSPKGVENVPNNG